jgi:pimeloyl-ACP methyl ester carboxylesterase
MPIRARTGPRASATLESVTLIVLPGLDGTSILVEPIVAALEAKVRIVVVEYPQRGPTAYADLEPLVAEQVRRAGPCVLLGWSFGGPLALRVARQDPERVRGVVLCASFVRSPRLWLARWRFAAAPAVVGTIRALWRLRLWVPGNASPEFRLAKRRTWRAVGARSLAARAREVLAVDARSDLAECRAPILCVAGSRDRAVPAHNAREIVAGARSAELVTIAGSHMALFTSAREAAVHLERFLSRVVAADDSWPLT